MTGPLIGPVPPTSTPVAAPGPAAPTRPPSPAKDTDDAPAPAIAANRPWTAPTISGSTASQAGRPASAVGVEATRGRATGLIGERQRRRRRAGLLAGVGALVAAVVLASLLSVDPGDDDAPGRGAATDTTAPATAGVDTTGAPTTTSAPPTTAPATTSAPTTTADASQPSAAPAGWASFRNAAAGYTVAHPPGWTVRRGRGTIVDLVRPGTGQYLRVDWTDQPKPSALGAWRDAEPGFASRHAGYRRIRIEQTDYRGLDAAIWEYTYLAGGRRVRAVNLNFVSRSGDYAYALNFQTGEREWRAAYPLFESMRDSFRFRS
jgi:hypothetical protein